MLSALAISWNAHATEAIDRFMQKFIADHVVPGASVAVGRGDRLLYAKGFGWAEKESNSPVRPDSLFRIASISKPITAVAIINLAQSGQLDLDDPVAKHLRQMPKYRRHSGYDKRIDEITIRDLLRHTGGWDRSQDFDPMGLTGHLRTAEALKLNPPIDTRDYITFMFRRPLQFEPGSRFAYSNFGYLLLGRIIEDTTGSSYEEYVQQKILAPIGISAMQIGYLPKEKRAPNEVAYYDHKNRTATAPFGPHRGKIVPFPYARPMQVMDAHGGWIASAVDLVRFAASIDKTLEPESIATMFDRQPGRLGLDRSGKPKAAFYALGWMVRPVKSGANHWHSGSIQGTSTLLVRRHDGYRWAILFNTNSNQDDKNLTSLIDGPFHGVINSVKAWPAGDLFTKFD